mmetsp:Transcript_43763/g.102948  ORF Transcript_43763/g.102948 Transcript_43763/m.102948 type:complete len:337 (-) Transcript_43763:33-1043(-)
MTNMFGSLHCCSQVVRRSAPPLVSPTTPASPRQPHALTARRSVLMSSPPSWEVITVRKLDKEGGVGAVEGRRRARETHRATLDAIEALHRFLTATIGCDVFLLEGRKSTSLSLSLMTNPETISLRDWLVSRQPIDPTRFSPGRPTKMYSDDWRIAMQEWIPRAGSGDDDSGPNVFIDTRTRKAFAPSVNGTATQEEEQWAAQTGYELVPIVVKPMCLSEPWAKPIFAGHRILVICPEALGSPAEAKRVIDALHIISGEERTMVEISTSQLQCFCSSVLEVEDLDGNAVFVMSQGAHDALDATQRAVFEKLGRLVAVNLNALEKELGVGICQIAANF